MFPGSCPKGINNHKITCFSLKIRTLKKDSKAAVLYFFVSLTGLALNHLFPAAYGGAISCPSPSMSEDFTTKCENVTLSMR